MIRTRTYSREQTLLDMTNILFSVTLITVSICPGTHTVGQLSLGDELSVHI